MPFLANWLLVAGVGLMGGSVARAARNASLVPKIYGLDPVNGRQAASLGLIDEAFADMAQADARLRTQEGPGLIVLAAPVPVTAAQVHAVAAHWRPWGCPWITEIGSTKTAWIRALEHLRARDPEGAKCLVNCISSHPMAGSEAHGPGAARGDLFQGARVLLSNLPETSASTASVWASFWQSLGAQTHDLGLEDHDPLLGAISHLPHAISFALGAQLAQSAHASDAQWLHGGGLRDTTRIAASDPALWADILLDNRASLGGLIADYRQQLEAMSHALQSGDRESLIALLERAAQWRRGFQDATRKPQSA